MEEIITLEGRQFKLTTDRPLTAEEKAQTIAEIRKQTGCSTCGQPKVARMGSDWQYGGVRGLGEVTGGACDHTVKPVGKGLTLSANPQQGVSPYSVSFRRSKTGDTTNSMTTANVIATTDEIPSAKLGTGITPGAPPGPPTNPDTLVGGGQPNPVTGYTAEGIAIVYTYVLDSTDIGDATSRAPAESASLLFGALITDSCSPAQSCVNYCKVFVACPTPVCDFTVS